MGLLGLVMLSGGLVRVQNRLNLNLAEEVAWSNPDAAETPVETGRVSTPDAWLTNCSSPLEDQKKTATVQIFCQQSMTDRAGMRGRRTNKIVSTTDVAILQYIYYTKQSI